MKELVVERAARVVLVADAAKLDERSFVRFASLDDVDAFVTHRPVPEARRDAFENADVDVRAGGEP